MERRRTPELSDIDAWGVTHVGKVRDVNQDHYFIGSLTRGVTVYHSSLGEGLARIAGPQRVASLAVVADGVGSGPAGAEAARATVEVLVREVSRSFHLAQHEEADDPDVFSRLLQDAALSCHEILLRRAEEEFGGARFATTLTLFLGLWPHAYLLQVGDSRCYIYQDDTLTQITRDQTWAQELIDQGTLSQTKAQGSKWANVLSSAIGGQQAAPVVTRIERDWGAVILLCSDGLTKHVSDGRIEERIASMTDTRQLCEALLADALEGGGSDNVRIAAGRTVKPDGQ